MKQRHEVQVEDLLGLTDESTSISKTGRIAGPSSKVGGGTPLFLASS